jgi:F-type H+-transporting ATPase subunit epsilon
MSQNLPSSLHLKIITPRLLLADTDVDEVSIPSLEGLIGVLPGHRPLVVALGYGTLAYRLGTSEESFAVKGGYAEILPDKVLVFTEVSADKN